MLNVARELLKRRLSGNVSYAVRFCKLHRDILVIKAGPIIQSNRENLG
jgi:hypothetical protein